MDVYSYHNYVRFYVFIAATGQFQYNGKNYFNASDIENPEDMQKKAYEEFLLEIKKNPDERPSAIGIGLIQIAVLCAQISLIIILDLANLRSSFRYMKNSFKNAWWTDPYKKKKNKQTRSMKRKKKKTKKKRKKKKHTNSGGKQNENIDMLAATVSLQVTDHENQRNPEKSEQNGDFYLPPVHYDEEIDENTNANHDPTNDHEKAEYDGGDMNNSKQINIVTDILSINSLRDANKHYAERIRMSSDPKENSPQTANGMEIGKDTVHYRYVYNGSIHYAVEETVTIEN